MDTSQAEEVLLDENAEAARFDFYMVGGLEPSPDHKLLAYAEDTSGNEKYTLHVKDIHNDKEMLKEPIKVRLCSTWVTSDIPTALPAVANCYQECWVA